MNPQPPGLQQSYRNTKRRQKEGFHPFLLQERNNKTKLEQWDQLGIWKRQQSLTHKDGTKKVAANQAHLSLKTFTSED